MTTLQDLVDQSEAAAVSVETAVAAAQNGSVDIGTVLTPIVADVRAATNAISSKSTTISSKIALLKEGLTQVAAAAGDRGDKEAVATVNRAIVTLNEVVGPSGEEEEKDSGDGAAGQSTASFSGDATAPDVGISAEEKRQLQSKLPRRQGARAAAAAAVASTASAQDAVKQDGGYRYSQKKHSRTRPSSHKKTKSGRTSLRRNRVHSPKRNRVHSQKRSRVHSQKRSRVHSQKRSRVHSQKRRRQRKH
jgi:hypothetical protein